jgi:hypothetical protein
MKLDKKQKVMLTLTVCAFLFLGWQVYDLFGGGSEPTPAVINTPVVKKIKTSSRVKKQPAPVPADFQKNTAASSKPATETKQYMSMVDQLEMYRMQSQVLQQQLSIAKARQQIAKVNSGGDVYSGSASASDISLDGSAAARLSYVAKQGGQWVATIDQGGRYQSVVEGGALLDGSVVVSINKSGVVLLSNGQKSQLGFSGVSIIKPPLKKISKVKKPV